MLSQKIHRKKFNFFFYNILVFLKKLKPQTDNMVQRQFIGHYLQLNGNAIPIKSMNNFWVSSSSD